MIWNATCVFCGSKKFNKYPAMMAPFLSERIFNRPFQKAELIFCKNCNCIFYNPRLDDNETQKLYKDYRGIEYQKLRQKFELNYTVEMNENIGKNPIEIRNRKLNLHNFIKPHLDMTKVRNLLDFGGDKGQFILDEFILANKYVYEISGVETLPGITQINNLEKVKGMKFEFIMCCHVLERLSFPKTALEQIKKIGSSDTLFYFEVPYEKFISLYFEYESQFLFLD